MQELTNTSVGQEQEQIEPVDPRAQLTEQRDSGANWFFWIAGLSVVNLVVLLLDFGFYFPLGLGVSDLTLFMFDTPVAILLSMVIVAMFVLFGMFAHGGLLLSMIFGMLVYALDGVLCFVVFEDWIGVAFHLFVLWKMFSGLRGQMQLNQLAMA